MTIPITARVHESTGSISRGGNQTSCAMASAALKGGRLVLISVAPHPTQV